MLDAPAARMNRNMPMKRLPAKNAHEQFYQDIVRLFDKHMRHLKADEMLAVAANMVGKLIALQDQRTMTREEAIILVMRNIEEGNAQAAAEVSGPSAGTA
jgi:hypothetical protein